MNARQRTRTDAFRRAQKFGQDHAADFAAKAAPAGARRRGQGTAAAAPAGQTLGQRLFTELDSIIDAVEGKHAVQLSGAGPDATVDKATERNGLMEEMRGFNRAAAYFAEARGEPALMDRFRMPNGHNDAQLIARAHGFLTAIMELGLEDEMIDDLHHDEDFLDQFEGRIAAFEAAGGEQSGANQSGVAATASLPQLIARGLTILKGLDAIAHNLYKGDAGALGAWVSASHVERRSARARKTPAAAAVKGPAPGAAA